MKMKILKQLKYAALGSLTLCAVSAPSFAQPVIAPQPCDSNYWRVLETRGWQEAEREIMMNQNLIFKPDSVMEYTCFDRLLSHTAINGGQIFSHTGYFGAPIIDPGSTTMGLTAVMGRAVYDALKVYLSGNFDHTYLGGRAGLMSSTPADTNMNLSGTLYSGSYGTCNMMAGIWRTSKCANFVDNSNFESTDGFYPLDTLVAFNGSPAITGYRLNRDTRQFPASMSCGGPSSALYSNWNVSHNALAGFYNAETRPPVTNIFKDVGHKTRAGQCGYTPGATPSDPDIPEPTGPAILTGVTVAAADGTTHEDGVCSNPGCTYVKGTGCTMN